MSGLDVQTVRAANAEHADTEGSEERGAMSRPTCVACRLAIPGSFDPVFRPTDDAIYCARCFSRSPHRRAELRARVCSRCGRSLFVAPGSALRLCGNNCGAGSGQLVSPARFYGLRR